MKRHILAVMLLVGLAGFGLIFMPDMVAHRPMPHLAPNMVAHRPMPHLAPDPDLPQHQEREATGQELEAVKGLTGKPMREVTAALGKPNVEYLAFGKCDPEEEKREGRVVWEYNNWKGRLFIYFHNGLMNGLWYLNWTDARIAQVPCD